MAKLRPLIFARDGHLCQRCKKRSCKPLDPHHRKGRGQCGPDTMENLVTLGRKCHDEITFGNPPDRARWVTTRKAGVA